LLLADAKSDEAMKAAIELAKDEPGSRAAAEASVAIGSIEADRDRTDDAIKAFEDALKIDPRSMPAAVGLARVTLAAGDLNRAETHVRQALTLQPANPLARTLMVRVELARGNVDRAAAELAQLEKAYPNSSTVLNLSAARHLIAGRNEAARTAYERVAQAHPDDMEALQGLIASEVALGRKKEAVDRIDAALKRLPPTAALHMLAARTYAASGDAEAGRGGAEKGDRRRTESPGCLQSAGRRSTSARSGSRTPGISFWSS
jgi:tetratricopeptide (TPR) repeat protein